MPSVAKRTAIERVSPSTPAFDAAYAGLTPWATMPWIDAMPTTAASGAFARSCDRKACTIIAYARRLTSSSGSHVLSVRSGRSTASGTPAACTTPPIVPMAATASSAASGSASRVAHVDGHADGGDTVRLRHRLGGLGGTIEMEVPDGHGPTDLGDRVGGRQADARGAAGDDDAGRGSELESRHGRIMPGVGGVGPFAT